MRGILKKLLCGVLVFLYAASFVMLAYTSVNAESVTEKSGNPVETDNDGDTENAEYGLSVDDYDFSEIDEIMKKYSYDRENTDFESLVKSIAESDYSQTGIIIEQMVYLGRIRGISKSEAVANSKKWLKRLGVLEYENAKLETLSKGNQQKVQLASTLVCDPDIVILDEPFSGLDPVNSKILQDVVMELIGQNKIVIFSSHQMSYVEEFCKDIVIINKGDVVLSGDLDNIKREFGKNQLVVSAVDKTLDDLENIINEHMSDILEITGRTKEELIIKNVADVSRKQILSKFISENIEIERFETYKPSLNDIFVSKVGDADEKEAAE